VDPKLGHEQEEWNQPTRAERHKSGEWPVLPHMSRDTADPLHPNKEETERAVKWMETTGAMMLETHRVKR